MNVKAEEVIDEEGEERGFNAAVDGLVPEPAPNPLEPEEPKAEEEKPEEPSGENPKESSAEKFVLGGMTEDEIVEKLKRLDELERLEEQLYEKVSTKVMGKFGEVQQKIQALQEKEFRFDPEKLQKIREVDEGLAEALAADLSEALSGQQLDKDAVLAELKSAVAADVNPYVEQRLLSALVPDAPQIAQSDEFAEWFFNVAPQSVRDVFEAWDKQTHMDGVMMARAFQQFDSWKAERAKEEEEKQKALETATEPDRTPTKPSTGRTPMTEEEAFLKRLEEVNK
jgi:hypothetical protein